MSGASSSIRPITRNRMSLLRSVSSSERRYRLSSRINVVTSVAGRFQFSIENAYRVRTSRPRRAAVSSVSRTASIPAR